MIHVWLPMLTMSASAANDEPARVTQRTRVALQLQPNMPAIIELSAVAIDGAGWTDAEIKTGVAGALNILGQCGLGAPAFDLIRAEVPPQMRDLWTPTARRLAAGIEATKPTLFFVRDTRNQPAFEAEAFGLGNTRTRPELTHTVWITRAAPDLPETIAHELFHVLANSGEHQDHGNNLMRDRTQSGRHELTPRQCEAMLIQARKNRLLRDQ